MARSARIKSESTKGPSLCALDNLTKYLNTALPIHDAECLECVWLPVCAGGCPHRRVLGKKQCVAFRDAPERYVLALHARI